MQKIYLYYFSTIKYYIYSKYHIWVNVSVLIIIYHIILFRKPGNRINVNIFNVFRPERRVKLYVYEENFD